MFRKISILSSFFVFLLISSVFSNQDEDRVRFILALRKDLLQILAATNNTTKFDETIYEKIKDINKNNINEINIEFSGSDIIFKSKFSSFEIVNGDSYMIKRAFSLPYFISFKINKYFLYKLIAKEFKEILSDDLKKITPVNSNHFINVERINEMYKFNIDVSFKIDVEKLTRGAFMAINEIQAFPIKKEQAVAMLPISSSKEPGIAAKQALDKSKEQAIIKEQERLKQLKEDEEKHKLEQAELERQEEIKKRQEKEKEETETKRRAMESEELEKKEKEERQQLELEEISQKIEKNEKKELISTEDYLKQMLYNRRKKEIEKINKSRELLVAEKKNTNLNSAILYSLDNKAYALIDYLKKSKAIVLFCWTIPEGIKLDPSYLNELVYLQMNYKKYIKKGIEIFSIYIPHEDQNLSDDEINNVKKIAERYKISYPILIDYGLILYNQLNLNALPITLILNSNLKIEDVYLGFSKTNRDAEENKLITLLELPGNEVDKLKEEIFTVSEKAYAYYKYSALLFKSGDLKASEESLKKSIYITNKFAFPFNLMGIITTEKKDFTSSREYFKKALDLDSTQYQFYSNIGYSRLESNELDDAMLNFQKSIRLNSKFIPAHYGLALTWKRKKMFPQAMTEINLTLDLSSKTIQKNNNDFWEEIIWFNQQKCIYYERYMILNLSDDNSKADEANTYIKTKLTKNETCLGCHLEDNSKINYNVKNKDLENYLKDKDNQETIQKLKNNGFIHRPVSDNSCIVCHNYNNGELTLPTNTVELCTKCHKNIMNGNSNEHVHTPVKDGKCIACHDPHSASYSSLLKEKLVDICYTCHKEPNTSDRSHVIFKKGECVDCHVSHNSFNPMLLVDNLGEICFNCHQTERDLFYKEVQHGPLKEGKCTSCHKIHGKKNVYNTEELCYDCHRKGGITVNRTTTLTYFRNGDFNLHEKHVNKLLQGKPITCQSCHEFHASDQNSLLREGIRHNPKWGYTINFDKNKTGGKCVVGCHKPREYNREKPVDSFIWK